MEGIFQALNFSPWTFFFQIINLLVVMGLLYVIMYKPITRMVISREERIDKSLKDAAEAKKEAGELSQRYQLQLQGARAEAQEIVSRAARMGEEMKQEIVKSAREEAEKNLAKAKAEIEGEKAMALAEIRSQVAGMVVLAASKIIERDINIQDQERLVENFIQGVKDLQ